MAEPVAAKKKEPAAVTQGGFTTDPARTAVMTGLTLPANFPYRATNSLKQRSLGFCRLTAYKAIVVIVAGYCPLSERKAFC